MTDPKDRFYKARREAMRRLRLCGFDAISLHEGFFDIEAHDRFVIKKIKICIDIVPVESIKQIKREELPPFCQREIWCKKEGGTDFIFMKFKPSQ